MARPRAEWDPSWDDDWQAAQETLDEQIEEEHPHPPEEAVKFYRYGFIEAMQHPSHEWSDAEAEMYQDYMSGAPEPGAVASMTMSWEEASDWVYRGWQAGRAYRG